MASVKSKTIREIWTIEQLKKAAASGKYNLVLMNIHGEIRDLSRKRVESMVGDHTVDVGSVEVIVYSSREDVRRP